MLGSVFFFIVLAGVQIMAIFTKSLYSKVLQTRFGDPGSFRPPGVGGVGGGALDALGHEIFDKNNSADGL